MPKESLMALSNASKKHKIRLVIRGMVDGSMMKTAALSKELGHAIDIDPKLFAQLNITSVPVFMVKTKGTFYKLSGNVTLDWAMEKLQKASGKAVIK
jgi:type-F conjugative transfer system pilin assembly protein TrbC